MRLGSLVDSGYTDDYGNPIYVDSVTGDLAPMDVFGSTEAPIIITDARYQDAAPGGVTSWLVSKGKATAEYVPDAPETILPGDAATAAINLSKLIVDSAGRYYRYAKQIAPTGEIYYTRQAANPAGGLSPLMLAAIAGLAVLALT